MDPRVHRWAMWWGTLVAALVLVAVGSLGYVAVLASVEWYGTPVSDARDLPSMGVGRYARFEGTIALNTTEDVVAEQVQVEAGPWTADDWNWTVPWFYLEDGRGEAVLVLSTQISITRPGPHDGDYHRGDGVCVGGFVTLDASERPALRADYVGKHSKDAGARWAPHFLAALVVGGALIVVFALERLFLEPRRRRAGSWRST